MAWTSPVYGEVLVVDLDALTATLTGTAPGGGRDIPASVPVVTSVRGCELGWLLRQAGFDHDHDDEGLRRFARAVGVPLARVRRWVGGSVPGSYQARKAVLAVLGEALGRPVAMSDVWTWLRGQRTTQGLPYYLAWEVQRLTRQEAAA